MLCDVCAKNQATVHLTEIVNEQMTELHLCEGCAKAKSHEMEQQFGLSDLLAGMVQFDKPTVEKDAMALKCPNCKLTYADFKKIGRLGCGECYSAFKKYLGPLLKRIHGSNQHVGKSPIRVSRILKKKIDEQDLRLKLQKAVEAEAFEEAARLRDQIKELEKKQSQQQTNEEDTK
jgi:protein arginine kinase activator